MSIVISELEAIASSVRGKIVEMSHASKAAHVGSSLSCVDILVAIYWTVLSVDPENPYDLNRDRFILSKGHAASALYATLAHKGFFSKSLLETYAKPGSALEEHPSPRGVPGVEFATGSLGHGLSVGIGMALAARIHNNSYNVVALLSDGECEEGAVWEAAMFAAAQDLYNIVAVIDFNKWQATGRSCEIMALEPLLSKWESFGWRAYEVDGHDMQALVETFLHVTSDSTRPTVVIAHTVKGKGISFMEDDNNWHYRIPDSKEVEKAKKELGLL